MAEPLVGDMEHIGGKIRVVPGEGSPKIIVLLSPTLHQLLELGQNYIIASSSTHCPAHSVIDLRAAVQRQHCVGHLPIDVLNIFVIEQYAVGGDGEAEIFIVFLLQRPGIFHCSLHRIYSHQRFTAKEVYLNVTSAAGSFNHEINGLFCCLHIHGHPPAGAKVTSGSEAVLAAQIAVVRHVKA